LSKEWGITIACIFLSRNRELKTRFPPKIHFANTYRLQPNKDAEVGEKRETKALFYPEEIGKNRAVYAG